MWPIKTRGQPAGSITWTTLQPMSASAVSRLDAKSRRLPQSRYWSEYYRLELHRPSPVGVFRAHRRKKHRQVGGPRIHAGENFTTAGNGDHTHLPPASDLRRPTHPSSGPGQRTARDDGPSPPGPAQVRGWLPRPEHRVPEIVFTNFKAAVGAGTPGK